MIRNIVFFLTQYGPGFKFDLVFKSRNDSFDSHSTFKIPIISPFSESRHFTHIRHVIKPRNIKNDQKYRLFLTQYGPGFKCDLVLKS